MTKWTRRGFVRTLGVAGLALPFARFAPAFAQDAGRTRFCVFFSPNGTLVEHWADGGERDFTLGRILEPLAPFREKLTLVKGLDQNRNGDGDDHQQGMGKILTGRNLTSGARFASGISIDQRIAQLVGSTSAFPSVELGALTEDIGENVWTRMCYRGASQPVPPENDPFNAYVRLFGGFSPDPDPDGVMRRLREGRSVLDTVHRDLDRAMARVDASARADLEAHLEAVRSLESRLEATRSDAAACELPMLGERLDTRSVRNFPAIVDLQLDVLAAAFACGLTRVGSLQCTRAVGNIQCDFAGVSARHHDLSHEGDGNVGAQEGLVAINRWYAQRFAGLLARLDAIPEGDGTVLDHTVVVWVSEIGRGNNHRRSDMPLVVAGGSRAGLRTGRLVQLDGSINDLWSTVLRLFGVEERFGDPGFSNGPIAALT